MIHLFRPDQASSVAGQVDLLFTVLLGLSSFFVVLIVGLLLYFCLKYRHGSAADRSHPPEKNNRLEVAWTIIPLLIGLPIFIWAAELYFNDSVPPANALEINVVGKQWMWQIQHPDGRREINELHIPVNQPVKLRMISQDVIHSFWVPDFRLKQDLLPGRYTTLWFEATQTGTFPLRCAEYCGTQHSQMIGTVVVMEPAQYQAWLENGSQSETLAAQGEQLFIRLGCEACHKLNEQENGRGPQLVGLFGSTVHLENGATMTADADYIRRSIMEPQAQVVAGFEPIMPTFTDQVDEQEVLALISYIQSLAEPEGEQGNE